MPKVSVIVPVYKAEQYLGRCVDSILLQTYADFELILVDDGSPDGSGAICNAYAEKDSRIRVIHKENGGVSTARNAGLCAAKGEFVAFVDSDDYIDPDYFKVLLAKDCDMSICGAIKHKEDGSNVVVGAHPDEICCVQTADFLRFLENGQLYTVWGKAFRTCLLRQGELQFREDMCYGEDTVFAMEAVARCSRVAVSHLPLYHYVKHPGESLTRVVSKKAVRSCDLYDCFTGKWLNNLGLCSELYSSAAYPPKAKLKWAFYEVFEDAAMPNDEKLVYYKLFFSLRTFRDNVDMLFPNISWKLRLLLKIKSPRLLLLYQKLA